MWISGHRHRNTVTPQPAPAGKTPEFGFWVVETASLREFPQHFRTFQIVRNDNNTVSIFVTNVDPAIQGVTPAARSRGYGIGAYRIANGILGPIPPHVYNAELIKPLPTPHTLTVNMTGALGTVKSSPYSGVDCVVGSPCSATYLPGTSVTLVPIPAAGAAFAGWSTCAGKSTCTVTMNSDITVNADFVCAATAAVTPAYKDFGTVKTDKPATATFTIRNTTTKGAVDLTISSIDFGGSDADQFALVAKKDTCSGVTLKPNGACTFQVQFIPTSKYTKYATMSISSDDPDSPKVMQLTGAGK
jgi:Divergent InlB B-repeat domain